VGGLLMWQLAPLFYSGGTSPNPPGPPVFPPPLAEGSPAFLGPTRGGVAKVGCSPLFWFRGALMANGFASLALLRVANEMLQCYNNANR